MYRLPHSVWGRRHFDMLHAQGPQRIHDGVDDGGGGPGRPRFTDGLHTGRCVGTGNFQDLGQKCRQGVGALQTWAGAFALADATHVWSMQKVGGEAPAESSDEAPASSSEEEKDEDHEED